MTVGLRLLFVASLFFFLNLTGVHTGAASGHRDGAGADGGGKASRWHQGMHPRVQHENNASLAEQKAQEASGQNGLAAVPKWLGYTLGIPEGM